MEGIRFRVWNYIHDLAYYLLGMAGQLNNLVPNADSNRYILKSSCYRNNECWPSYTFFAGNFSHKELLSFSVLTSSFLPELVVVVVLASTMVEDSVGF